MPGNQGRNASSITTNPPSAGFFATKKKGTQMGIAAITGEYLPAGESSTLEVGREAWGRIKTGVRMMRDDWIKVGEALAIGRAENTSNQAFGLWCDANGFGDIAANVRSDTLWLVEHQESVLQPLQDDPENNHPVRIRSAYRKIQRQSVATEKQKAKPTKQPKTSAGKVLSAIKDLSGCLVTGESLWRNATDKQRACLRQEIKHAHLFLNQLNEVINHEPV